MSRQVTAVAIPLLAGCLLLAAPPVQSQPEEPRSWMPLRDDGTALALRPEEPATVLTIAGGELWTRRGAGEWTRVEVPPVPGGVEGQLAGPVRVRSVAVAPRRPHRWLVGIEVPVTVGTLGTVLAPGLQVTEDGGATWMPRALSSVPLSIIPAPSRPDRAYLTGGAVQDRPVTFCLLHRWRGPGEGVECLADTGSAEPAAIGVRALAVDAADADRVYSAASGGLWVSGDGGESWTDSGLTAPVTTVAAHPMVPGLVAAGTASGGLLVSPDGGVTWTQRTPALPGGGPDGEVTRLRFDPLERDRLYAVAGGTVWASEDLGLAWQRDLGTGVPPAVAELEIDAADPSVLYASVVGAGVWRLHRRFPAGPCAADATTLCMGAGDRFRARVVWQDFRYGAGRGRAIPLSGGPGTPPADAATGAFWFFDEDNAELLVKVIDGADVNQRHWVFYGALTNVPFTLVVTDTATGESVGYVNPARRFASRGDTTAFPESDPGAPAPPPGDAAPPLRTTVEPAPCVPSDTALCLGEGDRFRVEVAWEDFQGGSGAGTAVPRPPSTGDADTGFFWFFKDTNLELAVKVLDGRSLNGHYWLFYGALTNVPFRLTVTDTLTGRRNTYVNPARNFASRGDTTAFGEE